jgi:hypothetical protein
VLGLVLSTFGSVVLILFGPFVGGETIASLRRRLPAAGQFVAAMTRMLIFGGLGLLALQYAVGPIVPVRVVVILLLIGAALLLVERIVLASLWALGGGTRPRDRV